MVSQENCILSNPTKITSTSKSNVTAHTSTNCHCTNITSIRVSHCRGLLPRPGAGGGGSPRPGAGGGGSPRPGAGGGGSQLHSNRRGTRGTGCWPGASTGGCGHGVGVALPENKGKVILTGEVRQKTISTESTPNLPHRNTVLETQHNPAYCSSAHSTQYSSQGPGDTSLDSHPPSTTGTSLGIYEIAGADYQDVRGGGEREYHVLGEVRGVPIPTATQKQAKKQQDTHYSSLQHH